MAFRRKKHETFEQMRRRLLHETEISLLYGLRFPDRSKRIPTLISGTGTFDPSLTVRFWARALEMDEDDVAQLNTPPQVPTLPELTVDDPA